jgi:hypothetical protein
MSQPKTVVYLSYLTYPITDADQAREALGDVLSNHPSRNLGAISLRTSHGDGYWAVTLPVVWRDQPGRRTVRAGGHPD